MNKEIKNQPSKTTRDSMVNESQPIRKLLSPRAYNFISIVQFLITLILIIGIFYYNFGIATVPSASMEPTLQVGGMFIYDYEKPEDLNYDDIVVFFPNGNPSIHIRNGWDVLFRQHFLNEDVYVKRLIGLPGDTIEVKDGYAWRNGECLTPDYVPELMTDTMDPYIVPEGYFFVMGDNRNNSLDSRYFGAFPMSVFFGKERIAINPL